MMGFGLYIDATLCHTDDCCGNRYVIQQYIGLNDKNKNEICEGDIVKFNRDFIAEIIWAEDNAAFQVRRIDKTSGGAFLNLDYMLNFKIIGNMFENPELLKK